MSAVENFRLKGNTVMSATVKVFVATATAAILSACSGHLSEAERTAAPSDVFAARLHAGYIALARAESDESDFADARAFGERALNASRGAPPEPETLAARKLPQESVPALADARTRLMRAFADGARGRMPEDAAEAQLGFDCWMQEQEEDFQDADIAACRGRFLAAVARIEPKRVSVIGPERPRATPAALNGPVRESLPLATRFLVYFDLDAAGLTPSAEQEIATAAEAARRTGAAMVRITGHADRAGTDPYNLALSRKRAEAVGSAMRRLGLPDVGVLTQAYGENRPAIATGDGIPEPRNRRVEIELAH